MREIHQTFGFWNIFAFWTPEIYLSPNFLRTKVKVHIVIHLDDDDGENIWWG